MVRVPIMHEPIVVPLVLLVEAVDLPVVLRPALVVLVLRLVCLFVWLLVRFSVGLLRLVGGGFFLKTEGNFYSLKAKGKGQSKFPKSFSTI